MYKKITFILILLLISISAVSASEDINDTISIDEAEIDTSGEILAANDYTVTSDTYSTYFANNGNLIDSKVNAGDTLTLKGDFSSKNFTITKKLTIVGSGGTIRGGILTLKSGASGSDVSKLNIINNGDKLPGIFMDGAKNCNIHDNVINNTGVSSYAICLNTASNNNKITSNLLQTAGATYGHGTRSTSVIVLGGAHNNYIAENTIYCADANSIYMSTFGNGKEFKGGECNNNVIYKNTITYTVNPTSWAYAIQMMGSNNTADSNTINGAYRGISSSNLPGNKAINNNIFIKGMDYSTNETTGGDYGVALGSDAVITGNTIRGVFTGAGISAGANSQIENNFVNASAGYGIDAAGDNVKVINNQIYTTSSAGVYQIGKFSGIVVDRNKINSKSGIGVLLSKSSKTKYPSDITITNNVISTSNEYMINAKDADKDSYTIKNNTGKGKVLTPAGEVDPSVPDFIFNGKTHYITPDNYHNYIDGDGNLMSDYVSDGDILSFKGEFADKQILVTKSVKITGESPVFLNSTFVVTTDSVWIENLKIINKNANRYNAWAIFVADTQCVEIINNDIEVYDPAAAYAVYIYMSSKVYVENNRLFSSGDSLTYTLLGYGAEDSQFSGNNISCLGTGELHGFEDNKNINANTSEVCIGQCLGDVLKEHCLDGTNIVPEIYRTYGVLMIKSSNNTVSDNDVYVTSKVTKSLAANSTNSLVGVDFYYDCDNNVIDSNTITVEGKDNYLYGAGALAQSTGQFSSSTANGNEFTNNKITVKADNVGEGLIFGQGCKDTSIKDNTITVTSGRTAYGITLESSDASKIEENNINIGCGIGYGIEAYNSGSNQIIGNTINSKGSTVSGIAGINTKNNVISKNTISSKGDGSKLPYTMHDVVNAPNSGVFMDGVSTGNKITDNSIETLKGYSVDLSKDAKSNTITDNYLKGEKYSGDADVKNPSGNTVKNNYGSSFTGASMKDVTAQYASTASIVVTADKSADGASVSFKLNGTDIGTATLKNGKATLKYKLGDTKVGKYPLTAVLTKSGFKTAELQANLEVTKANVNIKLDNVNVRPNKAAVYTAKLTDSSGNPVSGVQVKFYRDTQYVKSGVSDENGVVKVKVSTPNTVTGTHDLYARILESDNYFKSEGKATLTVSASAKLYTEIVAKDVKMYCGDGTRLYVTLKDLDGNVLAGQTVKWVVNGVSMSATTNKEGKVSSPLNLNTGNYTITFTYGGNSQYVGSDVTAKVTILSAISSNDINMMYKDGTRYFVGVKVNGKPVAGEKLVLNINGVLYERTTSALGTASIAINLPANTYIVTAERVSTKEKVSNKIVVNSLLVENKDLVKFYRNASGYTVKVIKQNGNVAGAGEVVTFNINGVLYERKTNDSGIAKLNINLEPNTYIITAEYKDCRVSNKIKVLPVLTASDLTKKFGTKDQFKAKLVDGQGKALAGAVVTFNINGLFYNRTTDSQGIAKLNINLQQGQYIITSSYNGANIANKVTVTA